MVVDAQDTHNHHNGETVFGVGSGGAAVEPFLWLILSALAASRYPFTLSCLLPLIRCIHMILFAKSGSKTTTTTNPTTTKRSPARDNDHSSLWRWPAASKIQKCCESQSDPQGRFMQIVLVPVLLQAMSSQSHNDFGWYSLVLNFCYLMMESEFLLLLPPSLLLLVMLLAMALGCGILHPLLPFDFDLISMLAFGALLFINHQSVRYYSSLHSVFTQGEWYVVISLASVALAKYFGSIMIMIMIHFQNESAEGNEVTMHKNNLHNYISAAGLLGCALGCAVIRLTTRSTMILPGLAVHVSLPLKLAILTALPLANVEILLWLFSLLSSADAHPLFFPRSICWITNFLLETEDAVVEESSFLPRWRNLEWLVYWCIVLIISLWIAPNNSSSSPRTSTSSGSSSTSTTVAGVGVVVARKWFHLVACLLFGPVTLAAPRLQSLSYAIALAALMVVECVRTDIPWIQSFYARYVDEEKDHIFLSNNNNRGGGGGGGNEEKESDGDSGGNVVVSHMALVAGCAAPLWIAECCYCCSLDLDDNNRDPTRILLSLWGVVCLGVGDAMGALIGTFLGRHRWGANRTMEGSLAMGLSMSVVCVFLVDDSNLLFLWVPAVVFTTLLEAFTLQIDNIVLPLAGSAIILLCRH